MNITSELHRSAIAISIVGDFTADDADQFRRIVGESINESSNIILDCKGVNLVDSVGLESFLWLSDELAKLGYQLRFANVSGNIKKIFEFTRLNRVLSVHETVEQAARSLG
tara:strand:+ start:1570 stop:1902 length:333 start_codon:yes stop_codon:yes gene_type:complete